MDELRGPEQAHLGQACPTKPASWLARHAGCWQGGHERTLMQQLALPQAQTPVQP